MAPSSSLGSATGASPMLVCDGQNNAELSQLCGTLPTIDHAITEDVCAVCGIIANFIRDFYAFSPLQEACMRGNLHQLGSYIDIQIFKITHGADPQKPSTGHYSREIGMEKAATLGEFCRNSEHMIIQSGSTLSQLYLVEGDQSYLAWTAHHAIHNAWMLDQLAEALRTAYNGIWMLDSDATRQFGRLSWRHRLPLVVPEIRRTTPYSADGTLTRIDCPSSISQ
ncbi:hypothetical protein LI328DRAFT_158287 [Trichoderma asperelloides]|nr:hypothetical protein LI328DRAFT_158287 [Trichoderma asperelloides]